ncbi:MAG: putative metal-binding motif-containing protein [Sandaracinaceae bacterium]
MRRSPLRWMVPVVGLAALSLGADYRGCAASPGASDADEGAALPMGTGCVLDDDCVAVDMCSEMRCLAGTCSAVGLTMDLDGDGFAAAPCGMDCEDSSPDRYPGAPELCDGVDQDCDGTIDEGAIGATAHALTDALARTTLLAVGDVHWVLGETGVEGELGLYPLEGTAPGTLRTVEVEVGRPRGVIGFPDGRIVVAGASETASLTIVELAPSGDGYAVASQQDIGDPAVLEALRIRRIGVEFFVTYDTTATTGARRALLHPVVGPIELSPDPEGTPPSLAFDGSRLVVTTGRQTLQFFSAAGELTQARELPGPFARGALADGEGHVVVMYRDAFDHALTRMASEGRNPSVLAPSGTAADRVSVHRVEEGVLVLRSQPSLLGGWLLADDLSSYRARFLPPQLSFGDESIAETSVAVRNDGLAAILSHRPGEPDTVAFLTCETR